MNIIQTKSFQLAAIERGNENSKKLAIVLPGRLDTKDYGNFPQHLDFLAERGYYAISIDAPGTWESPGGIELFTTTNYKKAVNELIEYFGNRKTFLMGHSRGGTISILTGCENSNVFAFATVMATYGDPTPPTEEQMKVGIRMSYRDMPPGKFISEEQKEFALPVSYFVDGQQYDVKKPLRECTKPKLIMYGTDDEYLDVAEVEEVFATLQEPKMLHKLECDHKYRYYPKIIQEVNEVVGNFLDMFDF